MWDLDSEVFGLAREMNQQDDEGVNRCIVARKALDDAYAAGRRKGYAEGLHDASHGQHLDEAKETG